MRYSLRPRPDVFPLIAAVGVGVAAAVSYGVVATSRALAERTELNRGRGDEGKWRAKQAQPFEREVRVAANDDKA